MYGLEMIIQIILKVVRMHVVKNVCIEELNFLFGLFQTTEIIADVS